MNNDFNFDKIGKKMPYRVPDYFFSELELKVKEQITQKEKKSTHRRIVWIASATAAAIALFFSVNLTLQKSQPATDDFVAVQSAFNELSSEDQAYIIAVYENDIFLNEL